MDARELKFFKNQIDSNILKASQGMVILTSFLDEAKQYYLLQQKRQDVHILLDGGFSGAEYKRALILPDYLDTASFKIKVYQILYLKRFLELTHRKVLGSLMSLGIKRESIGDIYIEQDSVYFACTEEIAAYIVNSLKTISGVPIELKEQPNRLEIKKELNEKTFIISSMRLDVIIAAAYKMSRAEAFEMISNGFVQLNHIECMNASKVLEENDIISVRHKGRIYVGAIGGKTKSGRLAIKLGFLV